MAVVALITANIILRRAPFYAPILGAHEVSSFMGALLIGLALPLTQLRDRNISVEFAQANLPKPAASILKRVLALICMGLCALLAWRLVAYGMILWGRHEVSLTLFIPFFPFIFVLSVCFIVLAFVFLTDALGAGSRESQ